MSRPTIATAAPLSSWLKDGLSGRYALVPLASDASPSAENCGVATILLTTGSKGADRAMFDRLPNLEMIAVHGVGLDALDLAAARERGIRVTYTPDVLTDDVADMAIALVLATLRRIAVNDRIVRGGDWAEASLGRSATGRRYGIVGLGRIGTAIARRLEGFSPHIAYHSRHAVVGSPYRYVDSVRTLAAESEVLIMAAAGGSQSRHLIDRTVLDALGHAGTLINIGRGTSIDEVALVAALAEGRLGGAGLDVFADEPHVPVALREMDHVVLQPHQASATVEARRAMAELVIANIDAHVAGRSLPSPVPDG